MWYAVLHHSLRLAGRLSPVSEYAGEIKDAFPRKKVTIVHSDSQLLNSTYPNKYRKQVEKSFTSRGVEIVFNDYVDNFETIPATTRSQRQLEGDLIVLSSNPVCFITPSRCLVLGRHLW